MSKRTISLKNNDEVKTRLTVWLYPSTLEIIDNIVETDEMRSRSVFLEKAALFYAGYLSMDNTNDYLPPVITDTIKGILGNSENHITRVLFKLAVETSMMMNVLASELDISLEDLENLKGHCINDVKKTSGNISFSDAVRFQKD